MEGLACQVTRVETRRCEAEIVQVRTDACLDCGSSEVFVGDVPGSRDQERSEMSGSYREVLSRGTGSLDGL